MNDQTITSTHRDSSATMTRRAAFKSLAGMGLALATVAVAGPAALANHTAQLYTVSANANFRTGPSTSHAIISVISKGATFTINGQTQNGYAGISSNGRSGWVLASLVVVAGSTQPTPSITGVGWTNSSVNLRSGPGTSYGVLLVVPKAAKIGTSTTVKNGFRYVSYGGRGGWMSDAFISATNPDDQSGNYKTTTANVNLRAEPSTSARILTVIPAGAKVQLLHTGVGQFGNVNYGGYQGWVAVAYLK